eukprot:89040-Prymnesium_polylepis.2
MAEKRSAGATIDLACERTRRKCAAIRGKAGEDAAHREQCIAKVLHERLGKPMLLTRCAMHLAQQGSDQKQAAGELVTRPRGHLQR